MLLNIARGTAACPTCDLGLCTFPIDRALRRYTSHSLLAAFKINQAEYGRSRSGDGRDTPTGGDLVRTMPGCVRPKVKDMDPFSASRE